MLYLVRGLASVATDPVYAGGALSKTAGLGKLVLAGHHESNQAQASWPATRLPASGWVDFTHHYDVGTSKGSAYCYRIPGSGETHQVTSGASGAGVSAGSLIVVG
jgi:hypothetical protein